jgi:hypothetical protein
MLWINLTTDERNTLEHLDGIHSGLPQLIELTAGQPVKINDSDRPELPIPDEKSIKRMYSCLERSGELFEILEHNNGLLRVKPKPFEQRGQSA